MKKARIFGAVFFWLLCAVIMYVIFRFSSETGEESKQVSEGLQIKLLRPFMTF